MCHSSRWMTFLLASTVPSGDQRVSAFLFPAHPNRRTHGRPLCASSQSKVLQRSQQIIPPGAEILSKDPLVYTIPGLLSAEECQAVLDRTEQLQIDGRPMTQSNPPEVSLNLKKLWPLPFLSLGAGIPRLMQLDGRVSKEELFHAVGIPVLIAIVGSILLAYGVVLPIIRIISNSKSRTSSSMAWNQVEDAEHASVLVDRVCAATGHPWHSWEAPVVTQYEPGALFARHSDASPTRGSEWKDQGGQRVVTCICYLNDVANGGETYFDQLNDLAVAPEQGRALIFFPAHAKSLEADARLTHESLPAPTQRKSIIQMFGRVGPRVPPPLGLPDEYSKIPSI